MTRLERHLGIVLVILFLNAALAAAPVQADRQDTIRTLLDAINGSAFEAPSGDAVETYKYQDARLDQCTLSWTEEYEKHESNRRTLAEFKAITIDLTLLDVGAIRADRLKTSGFLVGLTTRGLKPGFVHKERVQWGDEPVTESTGVATGAGFYFREGETARSVSKALAALARSCQRKTT